MPDTDDVTFRFSASLRIKDVPHLHEESLITWALERKATKKVT
jgi:hypothetical protein